jgi:addiction module RelE/StbE family toxin
MNYLIKYTESAETDLNEIFDYIAQDNIDIAKSFTEEIRSSIRKLSDFPFMGRERDKDEITFENSRQKSYQNYIIYYSIIKDIIYIEHIQHGSKPFKPQFFS